MTGEPTYRQAAIQDAEAIAGIIATIVQEPNPVAFEGPMSAEQVRTWFTRLGEQGAVFLCLIDGKVVGFSALDFDTQQPETAILGVWMLPEHRRQGLGTALAQYALDFARERGYRRIRGRLPGQNEVALSFLSGIGALVPLYNPDAVFELPL
ncbi:MAG: GNAT family N-acetyltransferase [Dehalococcoidia bacterium]